jgi:deoxycytidylate deaminase
MYFTNPYDAMQAAVDIVATSPHPDNKIAATLFHDDWGLSRTNYWPSPILKVFGPLTPIGNSSGTLHAETSCILQSTRPTEGAGLCITDPFCPNCAKNIAEAGIKKIYIDHKGFDKDFFQRRSGHFGTMSMRICEKAGISVYELWRRDQRIEPIFETPPYYEPEEDSPIYVEPIESADEATLKSILLDAYKIHERRKFCVAFVKDLKGKMFSLTGRGHAVTGFTMEDPDDMAVVEQMNDKYNLFQEPVNRMLMYMRRHGYQLIDGYLFCSQVPTSREQVNLVGAGIKRITIGDLKKCRDAHGIEAMKQLQSSGIINFI